MMMGRIIGRAIIILSLSVLAGAALPVSGRGRGRGKQVLQSERMRVPRFGVKGWSRSPTPFDRLPGGYSEQT